MDLNNVVDNGGLTLSEKEFNHGSMLDSDTNNVLDNGDMTLSEEEFNHGSRLDST